VAAVSDRSSLRLRGHPGGLAGHLVWPGAGPQLVTVQLAVDAGGPTPVVGHILPVGAKGLCSLEITLPTWTPPGSYQGTVRVGDEERRIVVDVEPRPRLQVEPRLLSVRGRPKDRVQAEVTISNTGNVVSEVRGAYLFALYDPSALERATARAFLSGETTSQGFNDQIVTGLREGFAGMVRLKVDAGAGPLEPGDSRSLQATLHLPDGLRAGQTYEGTWRIDSLGYNVEVEATDGAAPEENPR
jgi:hypothetical protein